MASTNAAQKSIPPNQTLFVGNLNQKVKKHDMRRALYTIFSAYGPVLDVVAVADKSHKCIAHIVFRDVQTSTQAMRSLQGYRFLGRELQISFAKGKSDVISRLDGSAKVGPIKNDTQSTEHTASLMASELQKSVFGGPPSAQAKTNTSTTAQSLKPASAATVTGTKSPQNLKRPRDDSDGEAPADDDEDGDEMDVSDDD